MSRSKFILVLALLFLLAVSATLLAQTPGLISAQSPEGTGTAVVFDDQGLSDGIVFTMTGVTAPPRVRSTSDGLYPTTAPRN